MKTLPRRFLKRAGNGSVAVEMAITLPIFLLLLTGLLFFARVFWYYSVAQKAAHDAARFVSTATQADLRTMGAGAEATSAAIAKWIADAEMKDIRPMVSSSYTEVKCGVRSTNGLYIDYLPCGDGVPQMVRVFISMRIRDDIFPDFTWEYFGEDGLRMTADVTMRYAGN